MGQKMRLSLSPAILLVCLLVAFPLAAQVTGASLSGTVKGPLGAVIADAKVSAKNVANGQVTSTQTNSEGIFNLPNLSPGEYEVSVTAQGFSPKTATVALANEGTQSLDLALDNRLSLQDLGLETHGSAADQARLDRRSHMLKVHQRLGLITTVPLVATVILGSGAGGRNTSSTDRNFHAGMGAVTAGMYVTTASFAIFAPKIGETQTRGPIRLHKALAWIHGPGMILTPILGAMAYSQKSNGEKVHGLASAHAPVAYVTAIAYGAAILSVSVKF